MVEMEITVGGLRYPDDGGSTADKWKHAKR